MTTSEIAQAIDDLITRQYQIKRELAEVKASRERLRLAVWEMDAYYSAHLSEPIGDGSEICRDWSLFPEDLNKGDDK